MATHVVNVDLFLHYCTYRDFNIHQDIGNHKVKLTDHVKKFWTIKCVNIKRNVTRSSFTGSLENAQSRLVKGWALKRKRTSKRFTKKVKDFVCQMFEEGENTGLLPRAGIKENKLQGTRTGIEFFQQKIG